MGSGSTGAACVNTGRKFIGIEKDKGYFNIAEKRINKVKELLQTQRLF
jgi:site-specific DNA-methyltransferase (adenine-specific)